MTQVQLNFTLRVSSKSCKSVALVGSWDSYRQHLPLQRDASTSKSTFRGTFRFPTTSIVPGQRYWYYYIIDAHSVTYDPKQQHVVEPTTGRTLNVLEVPMRAPAAAPAAAPATDYRDMRPLSRHHPANGRSLSPSQIQHPHPSRPYETKAFSSREMEALSRRYAAQRLSSPVSSSDGTSSDDDSYVYSSGTGSPVPSLGASSRSSLNSSPDSFSSLSSSSSCTCERFAITRSGQRVKLDCGGKVCNGSDDGSGCSSSSDSESDDGRDRYRRGSRKHSGAKHSSHSSGKKRGGLYVKR